MAQLKSIPRPEPGAGVPTPKGEFIFLYHTDDILKEPTRVAGQKTYTGGFELREGAKGIKFYATPGTIEPVVEKTGETDAVGFKNGFKWSYPGDGADPATEIMANGSYVGFTGTCSGEQYKKYGSKCNPLRLSAFEPTDNTESNKRVYTMQQAQGDKYLPANYVGALPDVEDPEADAPASEGM